MTESNLSKIKPQLRTTGNITGNFGRPKTKAGSSLNDLQAGNIGITQDEYLQRLYIALDQATSTRQYQFCYNEIKRILIQRGLWTTTTNTTMR
jgi:hypothetical protein